MQPSRNLQSSKPAEAKKEPIDPPHSAKIIAAALIASCFGSLTVWGLAYPHLNSKPKEESTAETPSAFAERLRLQQAVQERTLIGFPKGDQIEVKINTCLRKFQAMRSMHLSTEEQERDLLNFGTDAIPILVSKLQADGALAEESAEMLALFGPRTHYSVLRLAMETPNLPFDAFFIRAGKDGLNSLQDLLNSRGTNQRLGERALIVLAKTMANGDFRRDYSEKTLDSIVDVYRNTLDPEVREAAINCLLFCDNPNQDVVNLASDAYDRDILNADKVLKRLQNRLQSAGYH